MKEETQKTVGRNLRLLRTAHGLNQQDIANMFALSRSVVTHYENGRRYQDSELLFNISIYFNIDMASLFEPNPRDFLNIIANGINTSEQFREVASTYYTLSPYSRGRLAERARAILDEETNEREKHLSLMSSPFI